MGTIKAIMFEDLSSEKMEEINGGNAWRELGQIVGGLSTGGTGGFALGSVICGPGCGIVGGLYGAVVGGAAAGYDRMNNK